MPDSHFRVAEILKTNEADVLNDWITEQNSALADRADLINGAELRAQSKEFLVSLRTAQRPIMTAGGRRVWKAGGMRMSFLISAGQRAIGGVLPICMAGTARSASCR